MNKIGEDDPLNKIIIILSIVELDNAPYQEKIQDL
jgi:hypothetical protein